MMRETQDGAPPRAFWDALGDELDGWRQAGRVATFFWRDDDAVAATPALARLTAISGEASAPLALAVVPLPACDDLARALEGHSSVRVVQHGYAHVNHAARAEGRGAWELGPERPPGVVLAELARGLEALRRVFGDRVLAVVAPPWNRIDPALLPRLPDAGFRGVSAFGQRAAAEPAPGLVQANAHFDVLSWKRGPRFRGEAAAARAVVGHLRRRRTGLADPDEPTGILSHHLALDEAAWNFLAGVVRTVAHHPAACWADPADLFAERLP
jgi:peptidoglycan/xylan/chitin deacetylase (PgdA/CDA1 family)